MTHSSLPDRSAVLQRVKELEERLLKATPAPWRAAVNPHPEATRLQKEAASVYGPDCRIYSQSRDYGGLPETWERQRADAELIVWMRNNLDPLLRDVRTLLEQVEEENARMRQALEVIAECDADGYHQCGFTKTADEALGR